MEKIIKDNEKNEAQQTKKSLDNSKKLIFIS